MIAARGDGAADVVDCCPPDGSLVVEIDAVTALAMDALSDASGSPLYA